MIDKHINKLHFNERRIDVFFQKCWELKNPRAFAQEDERFFRFLYDDLKIICQCIDNSSNYAELSKFVVFFGVTDDPEVLDILADYVQRKIRHLQVDDILTILVNFAHTLSPNAQSLFDQANQEFSQRLRLELETMDAQYLMKAEDLIKIMNVLLPHGQLQDDLVDEVLAHIDGNFTDYSPEMLAEIAIIYATKMQHTKLRDQFFDKLMPRFKQLMEYMEEGTVYKFMWSFVRAGRLVVEEDAFEWVHVRHILQKR